MSKKFKTLSSIVFLIQLLIACNSGPDSPDKKRFNFGFEDTDSTGFPSAWISGYNEFFALGYKATSDSTIKHSGKYSLKVSFTEKTPSSTIVYQAIPVSASGKEITLTGYVKIEAVSGYAGLYLKLNGENGLMGRDLMDMKRGVTGNSGWEKLTVKLPFTKGVEIISVGATLNGKGTCWIDDLSVSIDGKDLTTILGETKPAAGNLPDRFDSELQDSGRKIQVEALATACQVWGFLKYHHPSVTAGKYDWDEELLRLLPSIAYESDPDKVKILIEKWVSQFRYENSRQSKLVADTSDFYIHPDYGDLFRSGFLTGTLVTALENMRTEHMNNPVNYYVDTNSIDIPAMMHEKIYLKPECPSAGYRLISLFRYYNFVQYFYPYKSRIPGSWSHILRTFIPRFIKADNPENYVLCCAELIAKINDTHAQVYNDNKYLNTFLGKYFPPFQPVFIEDELVVGEYNDETGLAKNSISKGDIIKTINGKPTNDLVKKYEDIIPASHKQVLLRDVAMNILRSNSPAIEIEFVHKGVLIKQQLQLKSTYERYINTFMGAELEPSHSIQYQGKQIFYVNASKLNKQVIDSLEQGIKKYNSIILDFRNNISFDHLWDLVNLLKSGRAPFAIYIKPMLFMPGSFKISYSIDYNNWGSSGASPFTGKIILLVNEHTQSSGEHFAMAFQGNRNTITVGTTTAGTDGNITIFNLPGFIATGFSGIGVLYPDKTVTQGKGIRIDVPVEISIAGFASNKDEILQKGLELAIK